jgi:hypothetical protein
MANIFQGGFRWNRQKDSGEQPGFLRLPVASGYGTGIFRGDPVKRISDGSIQVAAAGNPIVGFAWGAEQYVGSDGLFRKGGSFLPASTTYTGGLMAEQCSYVRVIPAIGALFEVDALAATATTLAGWQAFVGENADLNAGGGGNVTTGVSSFSLDVSTHATTNTLVFRIEEISLRFDADPTVASFKLLVSVNLCQDTPYTSTGT